jgi:hypothetical protein
MQIVQLAGQISEAQSAASAVIKTADCAGAAIGPDTSGRTRWANPPHVLPGASSNASQHPPRLWQA